MRGSICRRVEGCVHLLPRVERESGRRELGEGGGGGARPWREERWGGGLPAAEVVVEAAELTVQELLWPSALETGAGAGTLGMQCISLIPIVFANL